MGLIHSRASKKRDRAQAALLKAQTKQVQAETPKKEHVTVGSLISDALRKEHA